MKRASPSLIYNIQFLRAFAALLVVYFHTTFSTALGLPESFGIFGVDIFFVISGYIISYVTFLDPTRFVQKRIIRIVPFYWVSAVTRPL